MALRLLLDEHFSETDATHLRRHEPTIDVVSLQSWYEGLYLGLDDGAILAAAREEQRTLVTRDLATIAPLPTAWAQDGITHGGVIFVDGHAIPQGNTGALIMALRQLWITIGDDWTGRVAFLRPVSG